MSILVDRIFSIIIVLLPFLYQYQGIFEKISFGETILIPFIVIYSLKAVNKTVYIDKWLLYFYCISLITTLINGIFSHFDFAAASTVIMRLVYYAFLVYVAREHFDFNFVFKIYKKFVLGFSIYLIMQYLYYYIFGGYLPITLNNEWIFTPESREEDLGQYYKYFYRSSSLFLEPSYYALFVLPCLCKMLFYERKTIVDIVFLILLLVSIVLSTSGAGIIGSGIVLLLYVFHNYKNKSLKQKIIQFGFVMLVGIVFSIYIFYNENAVIFLERLQSGGSFGQRISRGILLYMDMDVFHSLFGVGLNNLESYMLYNNLSTIYDERNLNYSCTVLQTLNYSGLIGFISLMGYFIKLKGKLFGNAAKSLYWIIVFIISYESILFMYRFAFLIIMLEGMSRYDKKMYNESITHLVNK